MHASIHPDDRHPEQNSQLSVQIIATESSLTFFDVDQVEALGKDVKVWRDQDEWAVSVFTHSFIHSLSISPPPQKVTMPIILFSSLTLALALTLTLSLE